MKPTKLIRVDTLLLQEITKFQFKKLELDIFFGMVSKMSVSDDDKTEYFMKTKDFQTIAGKEYKGSDFIENARSLRNKTLLIPEDDGILIDGLVSTAKIYGNMETIKLTCSKDMLKYLKNIRIRYTNLQLFSLVKLNSVHSKNMYMYLSMYKPKKGIERGVIDMEELEVFKHKIGLIDEKGNEKFKLWADLRINVLDKAVKEINEFTDIKFSYKVKKQGKKVKYIQFNIERNDNSLMIPEYEKGFAELEQGMSFEQRMEFIDLRVKLQSNGHLEDWQIFEIIQKNNGDISAIKEKANQVYLSMKKKGIHEAEKIAGYYATSFGLRERKYKSIK